MSRPIALSLAALLVLACSNGDAATSKSESPKSAAEAPQSAPQPGATGVKSDALMEAADKGRVMGSDKATTWMVIVSDFQCPFCRQWHEQSYAAIKKDYVDTGKLRVAYLHFPLTMHPNAMPAAHASLCASAQGKFWETEEKIFGTQKLWEKMPDPRAFFDSLAVSTGVDAARQRACTETQRMKPLIEADQQRGESAGVQSTPTFFVGQRQILGAQPLAEFRRVIDSVLAAGKK